MAIAAKSLLISHLPPRPKRRATMQMGVTHVRPKKKNWSLERACLPTTPALCVFRCGDFGTSRRTVLDRLCDLDGGRKGYDGRRRNAREAEAPAPISRATQVRRAANGHCRARATRLSPPSNARKGPRIIASR